MTGWSKRNMPKATNIESLSDDVLFEILLRVPAQDLYDSTRLVCRKWYNMIDTRNFTHSHFQRSTLGLLAVDLKHREQAFMMMQNGGIEISKWSCGSDRTVVSSCNGLVLEFDTKSRRLYITNHVTKQHFALPPFLPEKVRYFAWFALAYVASSRAYKVVVASDVIDSDRGLVCAIMTVGVDTDWRRHVSTQHLSLKAKELLEEHMLTTRGFVHWVRDDCSESVLSMNVESEIITQIPGPCLRDDGKSLCCRYLQMGSYLSLFIGRSKCSWEVWKMKPETKEWTKLPSINLEPQKVCFLGPMLRPVGWSNSREVLFFTICFRTVAYNVRTREIDSCKLPDSEFNLFFDYISSLVWLD